jgi:hypothetical protein
MRGYPRRGYLGIHAAIDSVYGRQSGAGERLSRWCGSAWHSESFDVRRELRLGDYGQHRVARLRPGFFC